MKGNYAFFVFVAIPNCRQGATWADAHPHDASMGIMAIAARGVLIFALVTALCH